MDVSSINWLAFIAATLAAFALGAVWYGPLFSKAWMKSIGATEEDISKGSMTKIFGTAFVLMALMAFCLAMFLNNPEIGLQEGGFYGFLAGFGWVAPALIVNALYEQRPAVYMAINSGYWILVFTIMGLILGGWK